MRKPFIELTGIKKKLQNKASNFFWGLFYIKILFKLFIPRLNWISKVFPEAAI